LYANSNTLRHLLQIVHAVSAIESTEHVWYIVDMMKKMQTAAPKRSKKSGGTSPMDAALSFLGYCARTVRETERYLDTQEYGEVEIYETVERLKDLGLLGDAAYCQSFVESRLRAKPVSRKHLREQLRMHEADSAAVDTALAEISDETELDNAVSVGEKYMRKYAACEGEERAKRVFQRLYACGFESDTIRTAMDRLLEGAGASDDFGNGD